MEIPHSMSRKRDLHLESDDDLKRELEGVYYLSIYCSRISSAGSTLSKENSTVSQKPLQRIRVEDNELEYEEKKSSFALNL